MCCRQRGYRKQPQCLFVRQQRNDSRVFCLLLEANIGLWAVACTAEAEITPLTPPRSGRRWYGGRRWPARPCVCCRRWYVRRSSRRSVRYRNEWIWGVGRTCRGGCFGCRRHQCRRRCRRGVRSHRIGRTRGIGHRDRRAGCHRRRCIHHGSSRSTRSRFLGIDRRLGRQYKRSVGYNDYLRSEDESGCRSA